MAFKDDLAQYTQESTTPLEELAAIFGVSVRTFLYWRTGERSPHPRNLWPLRDVPDEELRRIVRKELNRQLPGVVK